MQSMVRNPFSAKNQTL